MIFLQYAGDVPEKFVPDDPDNYNVRNFDNPFEALEFYMRANADICSVATGEKLEARVYIVCEKKIKPFARMYFDARDSKTVEFHMIADIKMTG